MLLRLLGVALTLVLLLLLNRSCTPVFASPALESRLSRLELNTTQLRAEVNRLESQVSRLMATESRSQTGNLPVPPVQLPSQASSSTLADNPTFKRLATLVIELKERIVNLENRLNE